MTEDDFKHADRIFLLIRIMEAPIFGSCESIVVEFVEDDSFLVCFVSFFLPKKNVITSELFG